MGGPGWWLHAQTSPETTIYQVRPDRSSQAIRQALGEDFQEPW